MAVTQGVNLAQNTNITATNTFAQAAYNQANTGTTLAQASFTSANTNALNVTYLNGVNATQNTNITATNTFAAAAYAQANTGTTLAQASFNSANNLVTGLIASAYNQANTGTSLAQSAFNAANTINSTGITYIQGVDATQNTNITATNTFAAAAYAQANTGTTLAQAAFAQANTNGTNIAYVNGVDATQNTNITATNLFAQGAYNQANTGTTLAQASFNSANNLVTGLIASAYAQANTGTTLAQAAFTQANTSAADITVIQGVNTTQNTNIAATNTYAASAYAQANTATATTVYTQGVDATQNTNITAVNTYAGSAYATANAALPLAGGTITGSLTVNQDVSVSGNLTILGTTTTVNTASLSVADSLFVLASNNSTSDIVDIGFVGRYNTGTTPAYSGFIRDAGLKEFYVFDGYTPTITANNNVNVQDASFTKATLNASLFKGDLIGSTALVNGIELGAYSSLAYAQANTGTLLAQASFNSANTSAANITVIQGVNDTQNTNISAVNTYAGSSYAQANTNAGSIAVIQGVDTTQNTNISTAITLAQAAYNYANTLTVAGGSASYSGVTLNTNSFLTSTTYVTSNTNQVAVDSFSATSYRSAKYEVQMTSGSNFHVIEIRAVHDGANIWLTQYAEIHTGGVLGTFSASINPTGTFNLLLTPTNAVTDVKLMRSNLLV